MVQVLAIKPQPINLFEAPLFTRCRCAQTLSRQPAQEPTQFWPPGLLVLFPSPKDQIKMHTLKAPLTRKSGSKCLMSFAVGFAQTLDCQKSWQFMTFFRSLPFKPKSNISVQRYFQKRLDSLQPIRLRQVAVVEAGAHEQIECFTRTAPRLLSTSRKRHPQFVSFLIKPFRPPPATQLPNYSKVDLFEELPSCRQNTLRALVSQGGRTD